MPRRSRTRPHRRRDHAQARRGRPKVKKFFLGRGASDGGPFDVFVCERLCCQRSIRITKRFSCLGDDIRPNVVTCGLQFLDAFLYVLAAVLASRTYPNCFFRSARRPRGRVKVYEKWTRPPPRACDLPLVLLAHSPTTPCTSLRV